MTNKITKTEADWRAALTPEQYHVLREKGTERAFSGELWDEHRPGTYRGVTVRQCQLVLNPLTLTSIHGVSPDAGAWHMPSLGLP